VSELGLGLVHLPDKLDERIAGPVREVELADGAGDVHVDGVVRDGASAAAAAARGVPVRRHHPELPEDAVSEIVLGQGLHQDRAVTQSALRRPVLVAFFLSNNDECFHSH